MKDIVQIKNPKSGKYVKIDRDKGIILSHKATKGPYKNIPIGKKKDKNILKPDIICGYCKDFDICEVSFNSKACNKFKIVGYFYCSACEQRISVKACVKKEKCRCNNIKTCSQREILEEAYGSFHSSV